MAGRNLPAADYGIIAYWEVVVAIFVGLLVFSEALNINTILGIILVVGGGMYPSISMLHQSRKNRKQSRLDSAGQPTEVAETTES